MKVAIQIGYKKGRQVIEAWVNESSCSAQEDNGMFLTSRADTNKKGAFWYLWSNEVSTGDVIDISVKTGIPGVGQDENLTFEASYMVDENVDVREVIIPGVGMGNYPLIKGRLVDVSFVSEADKRLDAVSSFLEEGF